MLSAILLFPLLGFLINGLVGRRLPKVAVSIIGCTSVFISFAIAFYLFMDFLQSPEGWREITVTLFQWIPLLGVDASLKLDSLSLLLVLVVTGVGFLIHLYSVNYMEEDPSIARYFSYLNLFTFAMLLLVLANNLLFLFIGWEGVGLCSYLLIGFWFEDPEKAQAGKKAFLVNRIGDLAFLIALFLIFTTFGTLNISSLKLFEVSSDQLQTLTLITLLLFIGACGKSAQIPLYVWLPDAMAGPTPVSALIHAATMVTAGIYMIARMHFLYTLSPVAMEVVAVVGISTAFFAGLIALLQDDIKKVLAYSTVSQLGYMVFAVSTGAFAAGIFHLMTHAFFKACLFLGAGSVIHAMGGEQNIWKMGGLRQKMPITFYTFAVSVFAIAGIFPFAGFFSKDAILWQGFATGHTVLWAVGFITSGLTASYMFRLFSAVFLGKPRDMEKYRHAHESPPSMTIPLIVLGILAVVGGWIGIPVSLKGGDHFFEWLPPIFAYEEFFSELESRGHGLELLLTIATFLWVLHLGLIANVLYSQKLGRMQAMADKFASVYQLIYNKFYVDEIYQFLVIRPIGFISEKVFW